MAKSKKEVIEDLNFDEVIEKKSRSSSKKEIHISEPYLPDCFKPVPLYGRKYVDIYKHNIDTNSSKEFEKTDDYINRLRAMARRNNEAALNELGKIYYSLGDKEQAVEYFVKATEADYPEAKRNLAITLESNKSENLEMIFKLYKSAAVSGDVIALNNLGCCYLNGEGTEQDYKKAVECFEKAVERKDDLAHLNLAVCYTFGLGVERNLEKSLELYKQAADLGNKPALKKLAEIYYRGRGVEPDKKMALKYYRKATEAGDKDSEKMVRLITGKDKPKTKEVLPDKAVEAERKESEKAEKVEEKTKTQNQPLKTKSKLFTMQRYLQNDKPKELHIDNFDSWASTYAETKMALELAPEGKGYQMKTRFARFSNLPELMNMFKEVVNVKTGDVLNLPVSEAHFHTISAEASQHQKDMVDELATRAEKIRNRLVDPTEDNMLAVTNDGRKLALDQRLMNPLLPDEPNSKINMCVENVFKIWQNEAENKSTQIIFSDLSTPNTTGFNVYDDIKKKLIDKGIPKEQIAFIHDCKTDVQKQNLFTKVNNGEVRVLLGSTSKLGTGVNCQKRLKAVHHCDCPWKPAELEQRNGRIIRQGNLNKDVDIYNYIAKSTFVSYLYQIVENKQRFISQIMTSKSPARSAEDVDESVLNYAQIKAIAAGDPRIQEKMNLDIEVAKLHTLFGEWQKEKRDMQNFIMTAYLAKQKEYTEMINAVDADIAVAEKNKKQYRIYGNDCKRQTIFG
ncbi:MAG: hypothetical protein LUD77_06615 [Clostridiales bacterium]|nr:hypothetical protein [Clostridiales bacterium]